MAYSLQFIAGISEHNPLISGANIHSVLADMHATSNVWALLVDANKHSHVLLHNP